MTQLASSYFTPPAVAASALLIAQEDMRAMQLSFSELLGARYNMADGIVDPFVDLTGIANNSIGFYAPSTSGKYTIQPQPLYSTSYVPKQTAGGMFASSSATSHGPLYANDSSTSTYWQAGTSNTGEYIGVDFGPGGAAILSGISITNYSSGYAKFVNVQASNNNSTWTTIVTNYTMSTSSGGTTSITSGLGTTAYRYWRVVVTTLNTAGQAWIVAEIVFSVSGSSSTTYTGYSFSKGVNAFASSSPFTAANAFGTSGTTWYSSVNGSGQYIAQDFGAGNAVALMGVDFAQTGSQNYTTPTTNSISINVDYSNDGTTWTTATTIYPFNNTNKNFYPLGVTTGSYRYWRIYNNTSLGNDWYINQADFYVAGTAAYDNFTIVSTLFTANNVSNPSTGRLALQFLSNSSFTMNTDLIASMSRDGGSTFTSLTMTLVETLQDGSLLYDAGAVSLSSLGAGNSMVYKFSTYNNKQIYLYGAVFQWSQ